MKSHKKRTILRIISGVLVFCFLTTQGVSDAHALPAESVPSVPEKFVRLDESFTGNSGKNLIFIQDAHDSLEAQENIASAIDHYVRHGGVKTVYEEGYQGPVPTDSYFAFISDPKIRKRVSYFFLDRLRIGGAEYAHINRRQEFKLVGADNIKLHLQNIHQYSLAAARHEEISEDLNGVLHELEKIGNEIYPESIKEWIRLRGRFDSNQLPFPDYLKRLTALSPAPSAFPLISFIVENEKTTEREKLEKLQAIDPRELFEEMDGMENDLAEKSLKSEREKEIFRHQKELMLLKRLNDLEVSAPEYDAVREILERLNTRGLADFIARESRRTQVFSGAWEEEIIHAVEFYKIANARDVEIEKALSSFISDPEQTTAVLVFGGFHKNAVRAFLRGKGISYQIVNPVISGEDVRHGQVYRELMSQGVYDYEKSDIPSQASRPQSLMTLPSARSEIRGVYRTALEKPDLEYPLFAREAVRSLESPSARSEARIVLSVHDGIISAEIADPGDGNYKMEVYYIRASRRVLSGRAPIELFADKTDGKYRIVLGDYVPASPRGHELFRRALYLLLRNPQVYSIQYPEEDPVFGDVVLDWLTQQPGIYLEGNYPQVLRFDRNRKLGQEYFLDEWRDIPRGEFFHHEAVKHLDRVLLYYASEADKRPLHDYLLNLLEDKDFALRRTLVEVMLQKVQIPPALIFEHLKDPRDAAKPPFVFSQNGDPELSAANKRMALLILLSQFSHKDKVKRWQVDTDYASVITRYFESELEKNAENPVWQGAGENTFFESIRTENKGGLGREGSMGAFEVLAREYLRYLYVTQVRKENDAFEWLHNDLYRLIAQLQAPKTLKLLSEMAVRLRSEVRSEDPWNKKVRKVALSPDNESAVVIFEDGQSVTLNEKSEHLGMYHEFYFHRENGRRLVLKVIREDLTADRRIKGGESLANETRISDFLNRARNIEGISNVIWMGDLDGGGEAALISGPDAESFKDWRERLSFQTRARVFRKYVEKIFEAYSGPEDLSVSIHDLKPQNALLEAVKKADGSTDYKVTVIDLEAAKMSSDGSRRDIWRDTYPFLPDSDLIYMLLADKGRHKALGMISLMELLIFYYDFVLDDDALLGGTANVRGFIRNRDLKVFDAAVEKINSLERYRKIWYYAAHPEDTLDVPALFQGMIDGLSQIEKTQPPKNTVWQRIGNLISRIWEWIKRGFKSASERGKELSELEQNQSTQLTGLEMQRGDADALTPVPAGAGVDATDPAQVFRMMKYQMEALGPRFSERMFVRSNHPTIRELSARYLYKRLYDALGSGNLSLYVHAEADVRSAYQMLGRPVDAFVREAMDDINTNYLARSEARMDAMAIYGRVLEIEGLGKEIPQSAFDRVKDALGSREAELRNLLETAKSAPDDKAFLKLWTDYLRVLSDSGTDMLLRVPFFHAAFRKRYLSQAKEWAVVWFGRRPSDWRLFFDEIAGLPDEQFVLRDVFLKVFQPVKDEYLNNLHGEWAEAYVRSRPSMFRALKDGTAPKTNEDAVQRFSVFMDEFLNQVPRQLFMTSEAFPDDPVQLKILNHIFVEAGDGYFQAALKFVSLPEIDQEALIENFERRLENFPSITRANVKRGILIRYQEYYARQWAEEIRSAGPFSYEAGNYYGNPVIRVEPRTESREGLRIYFSPDPSWKLDSGGHPKFPEFSAVERDDNRPGLYMAPGVFWQILAEVRVARVTQGGRKRLMPYAYINEVQSSTGYRKIRGLSRTPKQVRKLDRGRTEAVKVIAQAGRRLGIPVVARGPVGAKRVILRWKKPGSGDSSTEVDMHYKTPFSDAGIWEYLKPQGDSEEDYWLLLDSLAGFASGGWNREMTDKMLRSELRSGNIESPEKTRLTAIIRQITEPGPSKNMLVLPFLAGQSIVADQDILDLNRDELFTLIRHYLEALAEATDPSGYFLPWDVFPLSKDSPELAALTAIGAHYKFWKMDPDPQAKHQSVIWLRTFRTGIPLIGDFNVHGDGADRGELADLTDSERFAILKQIFNALRKDIDGEMFPGYFDARNSLPLQRAKMDLVIEDLQRFREKGLLGAGKKVAVIDADSGVLPAVFSAFMPEQDTVVYQNDAYLSGKTRLAFDELHRFGVINQSRTAWASKNWKNEIAELGKFDFVIAPPAVSAADTRFIQALSRLTRVYEFGTTPAEELLAPRSELRENLRPDSTEAWVSFLNGGEAEPVITAQIRSALQVKLDHFNLFTTLVELFASGRVRNGEMSAGLNRLQQLFKSPGDEEAVLYLRMLNYVFESGKVQEFSGFSAAREAFNFDLIGLAQTGNVVPEVLSFEHRGVAVRSLLELDTPEMNPVVSAVRNVSGRDTITVSDIQKPIRVVRIQAGDFQDVYMVSVLLTDGTRVPFVLMFSRNSRTARTVRLEYDLFSRLRGDERAVHTIDWLQNSGFAGYTSRFSNSEELIYVSYSEPAAHGEQPGSFTKNSDLPLRVGEIAGLDNLRKITAAFAAAMVYFYDEERRKSVQLMLSSAGDLNFFDDDFEPVPGLPGQYRVKNSVKKLRTRLIALRGYNDNIDPAHLIAELFDFTYFSPSTSDLMLENGFDQAMVEGVLDGVVDGLEDKLKDPVAARQTAIRWFEQYFDAFHDLDNPVFGAPVEVFEPIRQRMGLWRRELRNRSESRASAFAPSYFSTELDVLSEHVKSELARRPEPPLVLLEGSKGSGKSELSKALAASLGTPEDPARIVEADWFHRKLTGFVPRIKRIISMAFWSVLRLFRLISNEQLVAKVYHAYFDETQFMKFVAELDAARASGKPVSVTVRNNILNQDVRLMIGPRTPVIFEGMLSTFLFEGKKAVRVHVTAPAKMARERYWAREKQKGKNPILIFLESRDFLIGWFKNHIRQNGFDFRYRAYAPELKDSAWTFIQLSGGKGTRMGGDLPKPLQPLLGKPLFEYSIDAARRNGLPVIAVGSSNKQLSTAVKPRVEGYVSDESGLEEAFFAPLTAFRFLKGDLIFSGGDTVITDTSVLQELMRAHRKGAFYPSLMTFATVNVTSSEGLDRIVRDTKGRFVTTIKQDEIDWMRAQAKTLRLPDGTERSADQLNDIKEIWPAVIALNVTAYKWMRLFRWLRKPSGVQKSVKKYSTAEILKRGSRRRILMRLGFLKLYEVPAKDVILNINTADQLRKASELDTVRDYARSEVRGTRTPRIALALGSGESAEFDVVQRANAKSISVLRDAAGRFFVLKQDIDNEELINAVVPKGPNLVNYTAVKDPQKENALLSPLVRGPAGWRSSTVYLPPDIEDYLAGLSSRFSKTSTVYFEDWSSLVRTSFAAVSQLADAGFYYADDFRPNLWVTDGPNDIAVAVLGDYGAIQPLAGYSEDRKDTRRLLPTQLVRELADFFLQTAGKGEAYRPYVEYLKKISVRYARTGEALRAKFAEYRDEFEKIASSPSSETRSEVRASASAVPALQDLIGIKAVNYVVDFGANDNSWLTSLQSRGAVWLAPGASMTAVDREIPMYYPEYEASLGIAKNDWPAYVKGRRNRGGIRFVDEDSSETLFEKGQTAVLHASFLPGQAEDETSFSQALQQLPPGGWVVIADSEALSSRSRWTSILRSHGFDPEEIHFFDSRTGFPVDYPKSFWWKFFPSSRNYVLAARKPGGETADVLTLKEERSEVRTVAERIQDLSRWTFSPTGPEFSQEIYAREILLLKDLGILDGSVSVFSFLTGADFFPGLFAEKFHSTEMRFNVEEMAKFWKRAGALQSMARNLELKGDWLETLKAKTIHEQADVTNPEFMVRWTSQMKAGDVIYLRFVPEYLSSGQQGGRSAEKRTAWLDQLAELVPEGVRFVIFDKDESAIPGGTAAYLQTRYPEVFTDEMKTRLSSQDYEQWQKFNGWRVLGTDLKRISFFEGGRMMDLTQGGRMSVLTKTGSRSELRSMDPSPFDNLAAGLTYYDQEIPVEEISTIREKLGKLEDAWIYLAGTANYILMSMTQTRFDTESLEQARLRLMEAWQPFKEDEAFELLNADGKYREIDGIMLHVITDEQETIMQHLHEIIRFSGRVDGTYAELDQLLEMLDAARFDMKGLLADLKREEGRPEVEEILERLQTVSVAFMALKSMLEFSIHRSLFPEIEKYKKLEDGFKALIDKFREGVTGGEPRSEIRSTPGGETVNDWRLDMDARPPAIRSGDKVIAERVTFDVDGKKPVVLRSLEHPGRYIRIPRKFFRDNGFASLESDALKKLAQEPAVEGVPVLTREGKLKDSDLPWIEYEGLKDGVTLDMAEDSFLHRNFEKLLDVLIRAGRILQKLHERGIIHNDIKPTNIFVNRAGEVMLGDFESATAPGVEMRWKTHAYAPPERGAVSQDSDVYSYLMTILEVLNYMVDYGEEEWSAFQSMRTVYKRLIFGLSPQARSRTRLEDVIKQLEEDKSSLAQIRSSRSEMRVDKEAEVKTPDETPLPEIVIGDESVDIGEYQDVIKSSGDRLTSTQEAILFRALHAKNLTEAQRKEIYDFIILKYLRFVSYVIKHHGLSKRGDLETLSQDGAIGLMVAVRLFDYTKGVKFVTYAGYWIRNAVQSGKVEWGFADFPPYLLSELGRIHEIKRDLTLKLEREPSIEEWADAAQIKQERLMQLLSLSLTSSMDQPLGDDLNIHKVQADPSTKRPDEIAEANEESETVRESVIKIMGALSPREQIIIKMRFGIGTVAVKNYSQSEIADRLGISAARVQQIESKAIKKVQREAKEAVLEPVFKVSLDHADVYLVETVGMQPDHPLFEELRLLNLSDLERLYANRFFKKKVTLEDLKAALVKRGSPEIGGGWKNFAENTLRPEKVLKNPEFQKALTERNWKILSYYYSLDQAPAVSLPEVRERLAAEGITFESLKSLVNARLRAAQKAASTQTGKEAIAEEIGLEPEWITDAVLKKLPLKQRTVLSYRYGLLGQHRAPSTKDFFDLIYKAGVRKEGGAAYRRNTVNQIRKRGLQNIKNLILGEDSVEAQIRKHLQQRLYKPEVNTSLPEKIGFNFSELEVMVKSETLPAEDLSSDRQRLLRNIWFGLRPVERVILKANFGIGEPAVTSLDGIVSKIPPGLVKGSGKPGKQIVSRSRKAAFDAFEKKITGLHRLYADLGVDLNTQPELADWPWADHVSKDQAQVLRLEYGIDVLSESSQEAIAQKAGLASASKVTGVKRGGMDRLRRALVKEKKAPESILNKRRKDMSARVSGNVAKWTEVTIRKVIEGKTDAELNVTAMNQAGYKRMIAVASEKFGGNWDAALRHFGRDPEKIRKKGSVRSEMRSLSEGVRRIEINEPMIQFFDSGTTEIGLAVNADAFNADGRSRYYFNRVDNKVEVDGKVVGFDDPSLNREKKTVDYFKDLYAAGRADFEAQILLPGGNLAVNDWFAGIVNGKLYFYSKDKLQRREMFVTKRDGTHAVMTLHFEERGVVGIYDEKGDDVSEEIAFGIYGQRIVKNGVNNVAEASEQFDDLRHLLRFPMFVRGGRQIHHGFSDGNGELYRDREKLKRAVLGESVALDLSPLASFNVEDAERDRVYSEWGYENQTGRKSLEELLPGDYLIDAVKGEMIIRFLPGIHPHTFFGESLDGAYFAGIVQGATHDRGIGLKDLADKLIASGAKDVFLWVNGKDSSLVDANGEKIEAEGARQLGTSAVIIGKRRSEARSEVNNAELDASFERIQKLLPGKFDTDIQLTVYLTELDILKSLGILDPQRTRVLNPMVGADVIPALYAREMMTADKRLDRHDVFWMAKDLTDGQGPVGKELRERFPNTDLMKLLQERIDHQHEDVLAPGWLDAWVATLKAGDVIYMKAALEYMAVYSSPKDAGRWLDDLIEKAPPGVIFVFFDKEYPKHRFMSPDTQTYLTEQYPGVFSDVLREKLSEPQYEIFKELRRKLTVNLGQLNYGLEFITAGNRHTKFEIPGPLFVLRKLKPVHLAGNSEIPENRSELRAGEINKLSPDELFQRLRSFRPGDGEIRADLHKQWSEMPVEKRKRGVGVLVLRKIGGEWKVLFGRQNHGRYNGQYVAPSGGVDKPFDAVFETAAETDVLIQNGILQEFDRARDGKESAQAAALRELKEETGIAGRIATRLPDRFSAEDGLFMTYFVHVDSGEDESVPGGDGEIEPLIWVPLSVILNSEPGQAGQAVEKEFSIDFVPGLKRRVLNLLKDRIQELSRSEMRGVVLKDTTLNLLPEDDRAQIDAVVRFAQHVYKLGTMFEPQIEKAVETGEADFDGISGREIASWINGLKRENEFIFINEEWENDIYPFLKTQHPLFKDVKWTLQLFFRIHSEMETRKKGAANTSVDAFYQFLGTIWESLQSRSPDAIPLADRMKNAITFIEEYLGLQNQLALAITLIDRMAIYAQAQEGEKGGLAREFLKMYVQHLFETKTMEQIFVFNRSLAQGVLARSAETSKTGLVYLLDGSFYLYEQARAVADAQGLDTSRLHAITVNRAIESGDRGILRQYLIQELFQDGKSKYDSLFLVDTGFHGNMFKLIAEVLATIPGAPKLLQGRMLYLNRSAYEYASESSVDGEPVKLEVTGWNHLLKDLGQLPDLKYDVALKFMVHVVDVGLPRESKSAFALALNSETGRIEPQRLPTDTPVFARITGEELRKGVERYLAENIPYPYSENSAWLFWLSPGYLRNLRRSEVRSELRTAPTFEDVLGAGTQITSVVDFATGNGSWPLAIKEDENRAPWLAANASVAALDLETPAYYFQYEKAYGVKRKEWGSYLKQREEAMRAAGIRVLTPKTTGSVFDPKAQTLLHIGFLPRKAMKDKYLASILKQIPENNWVVIANSTKVAPVKAWQDLLVANGFEGKGIRVFDIETTGFPPGYPKSFWWDYFPTNTKYLIVAQKTARSEARGDTTFEADVWAKEIDPGVFAVPDRVLWAISGQDLQATVMVPLENGEVDVMKEHLTRAVAGIRELKEAQRTQVFERIFTPYHILLTDSALRSENLPEILEHEWFDRKIRMDRALFEPLDQAYQWILSKKKNQRALAGWFSRGAYGAQPSTVEFWSQWFRTSLEFFLLRSSWNQFIAALRGELMKSEHASAVLNLEQSVFPEVARDAGEALARIRQNFPSARAEARLAPAAAEPKMNVRKALKNLKIPALVYLDYQNLMEQFWDKQNNAWNEQGEEIIALTAMHADKIRLVISGADLMDERMKAFRDLRDAGKNVRITDKDAQTAFDSSQRDFIKGWKSHVNIHLSKNLPGLKDAFDKTRQSEIYFFRYAGQDKRGGLLAAALLWAQYAEAGKRLEGIERDAEGFLTLGESFIRQIVHKYEAHLIVAMAA